MNAANVQGYMVMHSHPMQFDDLIRVRRISQPAVHPTRRLVAYTLSTHDPVENKVRRTVMLAELNSGQERELTPGTHDDHSPAWSPDGKMLAFVSDRRDGTQLWMLPFEAGGEAVMLSSGAGGASHPTWAPDNRRVAFSRKLYEPETRGVGSDLPEAERPRAVRAETFGLSNPKSSARMTDGLLFRHWNAWREGRRNRVCIVDVETRKRALVTPPLLDVPPVSLGGTQDFVFSPDGEELAFVANPDEVVAVSTNNSVFLQRLDGIEAEGEPWSISETDAMEREPRYSPDGTRIAYLGAQQAGYEADRMRVRVYNRQNGETRTLTENFDRSAREHGWQNDHEILFLAPDRGFISLYGVEVPPVHHADVTDGPDATVRQYTSGVTQRNLCVGSEEEIVLVRESMTDPPDLFVVRLDEPQPPDLQNGSGRPNSYSPSVRGVTRERQKLDAVTRSDVEGLWYEGADGDLVHGFLMKPPEFDAEARYPLLLLVHGGPQSAFFDQFHFRWNASVFAGAGFVVAMLNPRGSVGYGSRFTDQISGDWGGRCYEDLMRGVDAILSRFSFVEEDRMVAAGGSFGGFMISWIAGHTDRFRALVCHDGIFNQESMSYTTDELWFDIWEHGGVPFDDPERFRRQSPHLVVDRMNTPMLVVQGERDYRCPVGEGIALFTALQMRGVPSRLLYFEDEGHFVTKPANAQVWYETVIQFLRSYV